MAFKPIGSRVDFPALEEEVLRLWREQQTFAKSLELRQGGPNFAFYEGPPTANGSPGIHHVLARVFKDVIPRYKTMKGFYSLRRAGWDCHGLPVELEVEKALGLSSKAAIEDYGVDRFNTRCRDSVFRYLKEWETLTERIAFWVDMEHPYITLKDDYVESGWWIVRQLWDKGLLYQGHRVTPHCPRCGTSLSSHEVALGYQENTLDPSVHIKLELLDESRQPPEARSVAERLMLGTGSRTYLMAWTTTPWTLPANTALAVAPDAIYVLAHVERMEEEGEPAERLVLAEALAPAVLGPEGGQHNRQGDLGRWKGIAKVRGADLAGLLYRPLYPPGDFGAEVRRFREDGSLESAAAPNSYPVVTADFVSMDDGTGIVHNAPSFGEEDYEAGREKGLFFIQPVDLAGYFSGSYPWAGKFVKDADADIIRDLERRGLMFRSGVMQHTYPFCWRCDSPLLYYAKRTWYIRTTAHKDRLIAGNEQINWYPAHIKHGRFGDWLENNVDWALSRERFWGTPLPIWECGGCGQQECIGSREELASRPGVKGWKPDLDLHRPYIDEVTYTCPQCGGRMVRLPDVVDCWFDSGAMPVGQWHYPFENQSLFQRDFPADYSCEAVDQTRGWFYTLHALSTLLFDQPTFRNCICLGHILDAQGEKMSKARGNVVEPWQVIRQSGADALRWSMLTGSPPGNARRFSADMVQEIVRKFILTLWNTYSFFVTYANLDGWSPPASPPDPYTHVMDRWVLSELNQLTQQVTEDMDGYDPTRAGRRIEEFVDILSNWYVRRCRRRFWKSESDADKAFAYHTLYHCLVTVCRLLAPFTPFLAEDMYQNLVRSTDHGAAESVHLTDFPTADTASIDEELMEGSRLAMKASSLGRAARSAAKIKVRQPLGRVLVKTRGLWEWPLLEPLLPQVMEELNVKAVEPLQDEATLGQGDRFSVAEEAGYVVAVDTLLSLELQAEGAAREVVHQLQNMRRNAGFDISDRIYTCYRGDAGLEEMVEK
ncbi:MAG: isoleucine--tRNA ligase, partial [Dehalococcoidia bacterium]|nr:isoleucine--tRNA ligase [Dehalococcoidia bacterium]